MRDRVYLDWNATTPLRDEARRAISDALDLPGNASSVHAEGREARKWIESARSAVAKAVGTVPRNVVFTSGGTEANALALAPNLRRGTGPAVDRLVVSEIVHAAEGVLHVDAIQAFGKIPLDMAETGADLLTLSAHKIGGPKGVGALVLSEGLSGLEPLLRGGGQELSRRAGTENVAGIAAFGAAATAAMAALPAEGGRLRALQERLEHGLRLTPDVIVFSDSR